MASYLIDCAIKGASFYLIEKQSDLADIAAPSKMSVAYIVNGMAYIYDGTNWTAFEDFRPDSVFPLAYAPLDEAVEYADNATMIAKMDAPEPVGDDEDENTPDDNTPDDNTPDENAPDENTPDDNTPDGGGE